MKTLSASELRIPPDAFNRITYKGERIRVKHRSGESVVIISEQDLDLLNLAEDMLDLKLARRELRRFKKSGDQAIVWDEVKRKLRL